MQLFPAFMLGLLSPTLFHPWSLASGAMAGMIATIILEVIMTQDQALADYALRPGISTFFINCVWVVIVESIRYLKGRYGGRDAAESSALEESGKLKKKEWKKRRKITLANRLRITSRKKCLLIQRVPLLILLTKNSRNQDHFPIDQLGTR